MSAEIRVTVAGNGGLTPFLRHSILMHGDSY